MWITRFQLDSKQKIDNFVKTAQKYRFDTLFVQVVGRGQAYYDSEAIPKMKLDFDPLAYTVEKSHSAGLKVHAWLNAYYVWSSSEVPSDPTHVVILHPDWIVRSSSNMKFLDPSKKEVKKYLCDMYVEVAEKYDVDGIHFDYIRYDVAYDGLDIESRRSFSNAYWLDPFFIVHYPQSVKDYYGVQGYKKLRKQWIEYKCRQVNELVRDASKEIRLANKGIKISAAVYQDISVAVEGKGQNWPVWLKLGWIDFAVPMIYSKDVDVVKRRTQESAKAAGRGRILVGLGAYLVSPEDFGAQFAIYRNMKKKYKVINGFSLFSYDAISSEAPYFDKTKK
ncbi:MAG: family 10 glycosylhydrolase [Candidatus Margulisiibacteriota bacterium]